MKTFGLRALICLAISLPLHVYATGCEYDTQCKGDRICENGKCVSPQASAPVSKPTEKNVILWKIAPKPEAAPSNPPYYCCTASEKLGPYPNEGSEGKVFHTGDSCTGMSKSARVVPGWVCE